MMKTLTTLLAPILLALTFSVMFSTPSFAAQKYFCDNGKFGDGSEDTRNFGIIIEPDRLFLVKDLGKSYENKVEWKFLERTTISPMSQNSSETVMTLYSSTQEWRHMMIIKKKKTKSLELHKWTIGRDPDVTGNAQKDYSVDYYSYLFFAKCVSF
jgi:hypothetical protein